jgi:hypothetical protein
MGEDALREFFTSESTVRPRSSVYTQPNGDGAVFPNPDAERLSGSASALSATGKVVRFILALKPGDAAKPEGACMALTVKAW